MGVGLRFAGGAVVVVAVLFAVFMLNAWIIMLLAGAAHHVFGWPDPAWSIWASALVSAILSTVGAFFKGVSSK